MKALFMIVFIIVLVAGSCSQPPMPANTHAPLTSPASDVQPSESLNDKVLSPDKRIWTKIIPEEGAIIGNEIPLFLEKTEDFINWYQSIELSDSEKTIQYNALSQLDAPCCDEYTIDTC